MAERLRIKDIAERAGVSVGTVDRVLHKRPNVSKEALASVEKVLKEIDYKPNKYASALAYNRSYTFYGIMPRHEREAYWEEIEYGIKKADEARCDFNIETRLIYYKRFQKETFIEAYKQCLEANPIGVIIVPTDYDTTKQFTDELHQRNIPFVLLDSYIPDLKPLSFFGQDSFKSGYFAARMLTLIAGEDKEIMLMKRIKDGKVASRQQENREVGFKHYIHEFCPQMTITELLLPLEAEKKVYERLLDKFFDEHHNVHHCITLCAKAHIVGDYLLRKNKRDVQIMGYDMVDKNAKCLSQGSISFLIAQHSFMQGYYSVDTLFRAIVLKEEVEPINYMPIELLTKENMDFYRRMQL